MNSIGKIALTNAIHRQLVASYQTQSDCLLVTPSLDVQPGPSITTGKHLPAWAGLLAYNEEKTCILCSVHKYRSQEPFEMKEVSD